jgi:hypothetical protein
MSRQVKYAAFMAAGMVAVAVGYAAASDREGARRFSGRLHGYQEPPSVSSTGHGTFVARLDGDGNLEYKLSYGDLEGATVFFAHIHLGQRSVNGGVAAFLCGGGDKPPCPQAGGTVEGVIDPADVVGPAGQGLAPGEFVELIRAMRAGMTYANVHTNKHPGGEIRGQIQDHDRDDRHGR